MTDPLSELREFVMEQRWPPFDLIVEHAPDGTLDQVWGSDAPSENVRDRLDILFRLYQRSAGHDRRVHAAQAGMLAAVLVPSRTRILLTGIVAERASYDSLAALTSYYAAKRYEGAIDNLLMIFVRFIENPQLLKMRSVNQEAHYSYSHVFVDHPGNARDTAMARGLIAAVPAPTLAELFDAADRGSP